MKFGPQTTFEWLVVLRVYDLCVLVVVYLIYCSTLTAMGTTEPVFPQTTATLANIDYNNNNNNNNVHGNASYVAMFSYPIRLNGHNCLPGVLEACIQRHNHIHQHHIHQADASGAGTVTTLNHHYSINDLQCCVSLYDEGSYPEEEVSGWHLMYLGVFLALFLLFLRTYLWMTVGLGNTLTNTQLKSEYDGPEGKDGKPPKQLSLRACCHGGSLKGALSAFMSYTVTGSNSSGTPVLTSNNIGGSNSSGGSNNSNNNGSSVVPGGFALSLPVQLWDITVGLFCSHLYQWVFVGVLKLKVNSPRPIFHALEIFSSVHPSLRMHLRGTSHRSFPSGHSSSVFAGLGYTAIVLLGDAYTLRKAGPPHALLASLVLHVALGLLVIILYVGASRIIDYWHFANDVIAGWTIGFVTALLAYTFMTGTSVKNLARDYCDAVSGTSGSSTPAAVHTSATGGNADKSLITTGANNL